MTKATGRPRRPGRRAGQPDTRGAILAAARASFAAHGYKASTMRGIAAAAGCDAALIHHYFGSKEQLLLATVALPVNPGLVIDAVLSGPRGDLGTRLVGAVLRVWESPAQEAIVAAIRSAVGDVAIGGPVQEYLADRIVARILAGIDADAGETPLRAALVASQMIGVLVGRYVLRIEPLASIAADVLVPQVGATVQRYLFEPLAADAPIRA